MANITERKASTNHQQGEVLSFPMAAVQIYEGALVSVNAAGYLTNTSDAADDVFVGVAEESVDNSGGSAGDLSCTVRRSGVLDVVANHTAAQTDVGQLAYALDNQTIDLAANLTNDVVVGRIVEFVSSSKVRVDIGDRA